MIATASASMCRFAITSIACRQREPGRADLAAIRPVGSIRNQIDAELALRAFHRGVGGARRHVIALGVQLEVMDQRLHRALHLGARRRRELVVLHLHRPRLHLAERLLDDLHALAHLGEPHQIAVVAIAVAADRNLELHLGVLVVGLRTAQVPRHAARAQARAGESPGQRLLGASSRRYRPCAASRCGCRSAALPGRRRTSETSRPRRRSAPPGPAGRSFATRHPAGSSSHAAAHPMRPHGTPSASRVPRTPTGSA